MASIGGVAALLQIGVRADTSKAIASLRQVDQKTKQTAATAGKLTSSQTKLSTSFKNTSRDADKYTRSADKAGKENKELDTSNKRVSTSLRRVARYAVGAATAYIGIGAAKTAVERTTELGKASLSLNKNLGFTARTASGLGAVLLARGADARSVGMAFTTFSGAVRQARSGSEDAVKNFRNLGVSMKDLRKESPEDIFFDVSDGLGKLGEGFARTDLQRKLFGRGYQTLGPLIRSGSGEIRKQIDDADHLGATFSKLGLKDMEDVIAAQRRFKVAQLGLQVGFTELVTPAIIAASDQMAEFTKIIRDPKLSAQEKLDKLTEEFSKFTTKIAEQFTRQAPTVAAAFVKGFMSAPIWAQLATGSLLLAKFGGIGGLTTIFGKSGTASGKSFGRSFALGAIAAIGVYELGKVIGEAIKGHDVAQTVTEEFDQELQRLFPGLQASIGRHGLTVATGIGSLIFSPETRKVISVKGKQLKDFIGLTAEEATAKFGQITGGGIGKANKNIGDGLDSLHALFRTKLGKVAGLTRADMKDVAIEMRRGPEQGRLALVPILDKMIGNFANAMEKGKISVKQGMDVIAGLLASRLRAVGAVVPEDFPRLDKVPNAPKLSEKTIPKQRGGGIGGSGAGDKVPAMLEPGEFVLNRKAVAAVGPGALDKINRGIPRFAKGGQIPNYAGRSPGVVDDIAAGELNIFAAAARQYLNKARRASTAAVGGKGLDSVIAEANRMNSLHQPYLWGGGHGATASRNGPWDCSGAISELLAGSVVPGFSPVVSGGFASMFQPGPGPLSIFANASHVFASIGGKGFGTSAENPGGGAGWLSYSSRPGFTLRHVSLAGDVGRKSGGKKGKGQKQKPGFQKGGIVGDFARAIIDTKAPKKAALALMMAGYAESGMRDLGYGDASSQGVLQLLASTAASTGINPHDEYGVAKGFLTRGYWGKGGAIKLAGMPGSEVNEGAGNAATIAHLVQGNATGAGVYAAQRGRAVAALRSAGLKWNKDGMPTIAGEGGNGGGGGGGAGATPTEKFQSAFPGIPLKLLQRLHRSLMGPAKANLQASVQAAKAAVGSAGGPAEKIAAIQALNAAKSTKVGYLGALATYQKAKKSGTGVRKSLEALVTMEQALTAAPEAGEADTSALDTENARITAMNELIQQGNLLALQGFQVSASQNPLLGMSSDRFPTQQTLSPLLTSLPSAAAGTTAGGGGGKAGRYDKPVHVHIHGKRKGGPRFEDWFDVQVKKSTKKQARKGNRRLPSGRGA